MTGALLQLVAMEIKIHFLMEIHRYHSLNVFIKNILILQSKANL